MKRYCTSCGRSFTASDLVRSESRNMEAERKAAGLEGVRFVYYHCPACSMNDIFVDILPRDGESPEAFQRRSDAMATVVRQLHGEQAEAVVVAVKGSS